MVMSLAWTKHFICAQRLTLPVPTHSFAGQTVIVTGSNTGLGFESAKHFVRLGATKVILAVRTISKGEEALQRIEKETKRNKVLEVWQLDLASFESVKRFAQRAADLPRLDVVLQNAGITSMQFALSEGYESLIKVNVVSTMLLAVLLLPALEKSARTYKTKPRMTIVTSELHHITKLKEANAPNMFAELANEKTASMFDR